MSNAPSTIPAPPPSRELSDALDRVERAERELTDARHNLRRQHEKEGDPEHSHAFVQFSNGFHLHYSTRLDERVAHADASGDDVVLVTAISEDAAYELGREALAWGATEVVVDGPCLKVCA